MQQTRIINAHAFPGGDSTYFLDAYTGAWAAYSVRLLRAAFAGSCVRVRRSSDNTEADIGFSAGWIDETALLAHVGAGDGFVVTWYDQTANGRDLTSPADTNEFKIVGSGAVLVIGGKPALVGDGVDDFMAVTSVLGNTNERWLSFVGRVVSGSPTLMNQSTAGNSTGLRSNGGWSTFLWTNPGVFYVNGSAGTASSAHHIMITSHVAGSGAPFAGIGQVSLSRGWRTEIQEFCIFDNAGIPSPRADVESNINAAFEIY